MTQQKAASLTSGLFARKGKASPASLLISELEAAGMAGAEVRANGSGQNRNDANGNGVHDAAAFNGRRRPRTAPDLPLLAFVEAQAAAAEPAPAASLLDRGARSLRQATGRDGVRAAVVADAAAADPVAEVAHAAELTGAAGPDEAAEPETISGDANVAAIEDVPPDAPQDVPLDAPQDEDLHEDALPAEPAPDATSKTAAVPGPAAAAPAAPPVEAEARPEPLQPAVVAAPAAAPSIPASVALREAVARPAPAAHAPVQQATVARIAAATRPQARASSLAWRSAAVLALGATLGLSFYLVVTGLPAEPVVATASIVATPAAAEPVAPGPVAPGPVVAAPQAAPPLAAPAGAPAGASLPQAVAALPEPSFDIIRIEPDGQSIIAGRAAPGSEWILLNNGSPIAALRADGNGEWVVLPDSALVPGANDFSLVPKTERGRVVLPAPAELSPAGPSPAGEPAPTGVAPAGALEAAPATAPRAELAPREREPAIPAPPRPKPQRETGMAAASAVASPVSFRGSFQASAGGDYEVQLASVRQSADAERERGRLSAAFPELLGAMDLRVQQASLEGAGIFYRVRSGALGELDVARALCRELEAAGQGCLVVRRPEAPPKEVVEDSPHAASAVRQQAERTR